MYMYNVCEEKNEKEVVRGRDWSRDKTQEREREVYLNTKKYIHMYMHVLNYAI